MTTTVTAGDRTAAARRQIEALFPTGSTDRGQQFDVIGRTPEGTL
ncbi:hypothetical protein ACFY30_27470 [Streptomyces sp. NPDC000345]